MALVAVAALTAGCCQEAGRADLKVGDCVQGFTVTGVTDLPEVAGRLWRMTYDRNGAQLAWLERADENKTFGIAFRTLPEDDTGLAHIMEHSVLCGSAKYPVKEPFVDLLKSSLATFLNAFTAKDQTVYPVSSRNDRDFLNLTDVYLDAVFHPRSIETPVMFQQEGWHYEFGKDGTLVRNGVVYNEMKGVYDNPESVAFYEICKLLFPDTPYRYVSGGDPAHIGELTFEQYRAFHKRYYHPSNARIFLDGTVPLEETLAKLDSYLKDFTRRPAEAPIPVQKPVTRTAQLPYAIGADESPTNKILMAEAWVLGHFDETIKLRAFEILAEALTGSNEAPLKKALLEKGLCADVGLDTLGMRQLAAFLFVKHIPDGRVEEFRTTFRTTLENLVTQGLDHTRLSAILDRHEFRTREFFSGGGSTGVKFLGAALDQWLYDGDPAASFRADADFATLRRYIAEGWFERFLRDTLLTNAHHAQLTLTPSPTLAKERQQAEAQRLAQTAAAWDEATKARVRAETAAVDAFRNKVNTPEELATLPTLALADIPVRGKERRCAETTCQGVNVFRPAAGAKGVFYMRLCFDVGDLTAEERRVLPFLATVLGELPTQKHDTLALRSALDAGLGHFSTALHTYAAKPNDTENVHTIFSVDVAALDSKAAEVARLVPEVLLTTHFTNRVAVADLLKQTRLAKERATTTIGARTWAARRALASFSAKGKVEEELCGLTQLRYLQQLEKNNAAQAGTLGTALAKAAQRIFTRARLTVFLSDNYPLPDAGALPALLAAFPAGTKGAPVKVTPRERMREGFIIAGESAYAAQASHTANIGAAARGCDAVAARLLSLTYLWDEIRVKGGAYGGGLSVSPNGEMRFLSWRDPRPARSLNCYAQAAQALRTFAAGPECLDRYIVGTVGSTDPCLAPSDETTLAADLYFSGRTYENLQRLRREVLATTKADLSTFADRLDRLTGTSAICVIGGENSLKACSNLLDKVEYVVPNH